MLPGRLDHRTLAAALADASAAEQEFDDARAWLETASRGPMDPISAEVWAVDAAFRHVLLVHHRWRGWVPPGGKVEDGETPRVAASREFLEETGLTVELLALPAAVAVRSYHPAWAPTLGLSYGAIVDARLPLSGERDQPAAWIALDQDWESVFPQDRPRIRDFANRIAHANSAASH